MKEAYPDAPLLIGSNEAFLLRDADANLSGPFGAPLYSPAADRLVADSERIEIAGLGFEVREIPGHSPARSFSSAISSIPHLCLEAMFSSPARSVEPTWGATCGNYCWEFARSCCRFPIRRWSILVMAPRLRWAPRNDRIPS